MINSVKKHDLAITPLLSSVSASHQTPPLIFDRQPCQNVPPGPTNEALTSVYREGSAKKTIQSEQQLGRSSPGFGPGLMDVFVSRLVHMPPKTVCMFVVGHTCQSRTSPDKIS